MGLSLLFIVLVLLNENPSVSQTAWQSTPYMFYVPWSKARKDIFQR